MTITLRKVISSVSVETVSIFLVEGKYNETTLGASSKHIATQEASYDHSRTKI